MGRNQKFLGAPGADWGACQMRRPWQRDVAEAPRVEHLVQGLSGTKSSALGAMELVGTEVESVKEGRMCLRALP